jgi:hypothetical protein
MFSHQLDTHVRIAAPPDQVIDRLCDTGTITKWSTFTRRMAVTSGGGPGGAVVAGAVLDLGLDPAGDGRKLLDFTPTVLVRSDTELRWVGLMAGAAVFRGEHFFVATAADGGGTDLHHGETFSGALVPLFRMLWLEGTRRGFERQNEELKKVLEG